MSDEITKPSIYAALTAALDGAKLSKAARHRIEAAARDLVAAERARIEAVDVPAECVEAVGKAAAFGTRLGYLAAVRDCASERQQHGGEALEAAIAAFEAEQEALCDAPLNVLRRATTRAAVDAENGLRAEMRPRPENRVTYYGPNPLAAMAERTRDAAANAAGIEVRDVGVAPADETQRNE